MKKSLLLLLLAASALLSCVNAYLPDSDIAFVAEGEGGKYPIHAYWFTLPNGCKIADEWKVKDAIYTWSGACSNGLAQGCGQLVRFPGHPTLQHIVKGCFVKGRKDGVIFEATPGHRYKKTYRNGQLVSYDGSELVQSEMDAIEAASNAEAKRRELQNKQETQQALQQLYSTASVSLKPGSVAQQTATALANASDAGAAGNNSLGGSCGGGQAFARSAHGDTSCCLSYQANPRGDGYFTNACSYPIAVFLCRKAYKDDPTYTNAEWPCHANATHIIKANSSDRTHPEEQRVLRDASNAWAECRTNSQGSTDLTRQGQLPSGASKYVCRTASPASDASGATAR